MTGFYNITTVIKNQLLQDHFCNTVTIGDIYEVDLNKQTIFPLSHIIVNSADLESNVWRFNLSVISMDIVDKSKDLVTDKFTGNDNEHDVLNTQHAVLNRLLEVLRRGSLVDEHYQLDGNPTLEPFTERFENYLAGWVATFDVIIPNDMTACDGFSTPTVICEGTTLTIKDDAANLLYTINLTSGETANQVISDSTITITDDSANTLYTISVNAEGTAEQIISDSTITITDDSANTLYTLSVNAEGTANQIISDSTAVLKDSAGSTISTTSINAEGSSDITAPDGVVTITDDSANVLHTVNVKSNGTANQVISDSSVENSDASYSTSVNAEGSLVLPDITVTDIDGSTYSFPSVKNVTCTPNPQDLVIYAPYSSGDDTISFTIVTGSDGTITSADTTGLTSVAYDVNGSPETLPITLAVSDVLTITFDAAGSDGVVILTGTYA